ncbi:TIGR03016 family PEP-CTERM system-associated outer membrane protein [Azohydromonas caseinilytica]|uniref:TIGR03016 family PEP-CTERM system-associated outer membrane protein n=1 Tax=Azohydromonas caseinilytica TaxID=2728836 RepID=A0A848F2W5_9BURK|nr:TIGR03016 family PEP-CTERM system-associated outer membrane protein [Azohydromonas caseinilytica]NML14397.1 TIGR03016 family PEP-CTERM system-associated outer membrane protein [Azohydromonas caseinilytica]
MKNTITALPVLGMLAMAVTSAWAQQDDQPLESAASVPVRFEPRLGLTQTITSNVDLRPQRRADTVTRISPGVLLRRQSGRVQGFLDYTLSGLAYARSTERNSLLNALQSKGQAELLEQHAYVDAEASITQQAINPLRSQSTDDQLGRGNRTEVRTLSVTPRIQGRFGDVAKWDARVAYQTSQADSSAVSNSSATSAQLQLSNGDLPTTIGWSLQASHNTQDFSRGRSTVSDIARGVLNYRISPEFTAGVIGGYESTDIGSIEKEGRATYGWRLSWTPSQRTGLQAEQEKRFFGSAYNIRFAHRMARMVLGYTDTRSMSNGVGQPVLVGVGSYFERMTQDWASQIPDQAQREALVLARLRELNIDPNAQVLESFLSSAVTVQRNQQLSVGWVGPRDTLSFAFQRTSGRRLDTLPGVSVGDILSNETIDQQGYSMTLAHRLTPLSTLTLGYTQRRAAGSVNGSTTLRSGTAQWSTKLGPRTTLLLLGRHARSKGGLEPYTESALIGTFGLTF